MFRITDKDFQYTPSFSTDLEKKFRNVMRENRATARAKAEAAETSLPNTVVALAPRRSPLKA